MFPGEEVKIILRLSSVENGFQFYIEDNGKGIAPLYLPYIFDKFFRVPEGNLHNVKGYGLGLNFVKKLVESINGNVIVKSELNVGTTFIIKI
ncbi:ATP-binding protein [Chryseobacterium arthrosphaerae]|uniref:histidine kinase n=1 Tax=Chryseobacterium arthrosphaerae TaxID=651561 RepID=A0A3S0N646_9FLAO|nr:ATP-binding protein [Chryseobacterium arthrosphaerae]